MRLLHIRKEIANRRTESGFIRVALSKGVDSIHAFAQQAIHVAKSVSG
jgi:hypothetical protein